MEVLDPFKSSIVIGPAIRGGLNDPVGWEIGLGVPGGKVGFALYDQKGRYHKTVARDTLNSRRPFSIASLQLLPSALSIGTCDDHTAADDSHHKAGLVKVIEVLVLDRVLGAHILHQPEPRVDFGWVFAESSLEVVRTWITRLQLLATLYEAVFPSLPNWPRATRREQNIRHIFNVLEPGWKSTQI
jgi:hypothetical protein